MFKESAILQNEIYEELNWDPRVPEGDIGVSVTRGIITLSGTIPSFAEKWAAEDAAKKVAGVHAVVNKIEVQLPNQHVRDDQGIAEAAYNALAWNIWVPKDSVKIVVQKGHLSLSGVVATYHQRKTAEAAVRSLPGVRGISNEIKVHASVQVKDIQAQIKRALHRHAEEDAKLVHVEVRDGDVVLSGIVPSWGEKSEAEWAAWGTIGVRSVKNDISVRV
jgi:osmotically-inducible protein OsmY